LLGAVQRLINKPQTLDARFVQARDRVQAALGTRFRRFRVIKCLTLEMLADKAKLHANYVGAVERGKLKSEYNIWRMADDLDLDATELMQALPARKPA
jgi:transcriptional regulator with XRE-family HTH domain